MSDPITWGLINLVKKGVKSVQTTLDGVSDKVSGLPDSLDDDFTEVKNAISGVKADTETISNSVSNLPASLEEDFTEVKNAISGVKADTGTISTINTNVNTLLDGRVVKSAQRGCRYINISGASSQTISISSVNPSKSLLVLDGLGIQGSAVPQYWGVKLNTNNITISWNDTSYIRANVYWTVVEFY